MSVVTCSKENLVITADNRIFLHNIEKNSSTELEIPALEIPSNLTLNQVEALKKEKLSVISATFSKCGKYFAVCITNKQLIVYDENFRVKHNLTLARAVSKIRFTTNLDIVVADKTGDVYLYKIQSENCKIEQLLGHLSMVLDVVITDDLKYIITCDRDEKIRVSCYPNSYNIVSYCLGHEEFVLNLEIFNKNILISASGDGTIRFWDFLTGKELKTINTNDFIKDKILIENFCKFMDSQIVDINKLPITVMKLTNINNINLIIISVYTFDGLLIFEILNNLEVKLVQILEISNIISFDISDKLYVLTNNELLIYELLDSKFSLSNFNLNNFYALCQGSLKNVVSENISVLYKRKYNNVQEYQERKRLRIEICKK